MNDNFFQGLVSGFGNGVRLYDMAGEAKTRRDERERARAERDAYAKEFEKGNNPKADTSLQSVAEKDNAVREFARNFSAIQSGQPSMQSAQSQGSQAVRYPEGYSPAQTFPVDDYRSTPSLQMAEQSYSPAPQPENSTPTALSQYLQSSTPLIAGKKKASHLENLTTGKFTSMA